MASKVLKTEIQEKQKFSETDNIQKDNNQKKRLDLNDLLKRLKEKKKHDNKIQLLIIALSVALFLVIAIIVIL